MKEGSAISAAQIDVLEVADLVVKAYKAGYRAGTAQLRAARLEADRLWLLTFGEKDRRDYLLDRLDRCAELVDDDVDDHLAEAFRIYVASLVNVRESVSIDV